MKLFQSKLFWLVVLVVSLSLLFAATVAAQEVTPEPPPVVVQPPLVIAPDAPISINLITLISGLGIGVVVGGGSVLVVVSRLRNDKVLLSALESLAKSWPADVKDVLKNQVSPVLKDGAAILDEITDDTPVLEKGF